MNNNNNNNNLYRVEDAYLSLSLSCYAATTILKQQQQQQQQPKFSIPEQV